MDRQRNLRRRQRNEFRSTKSRRVGSRRGALLSVELLFVLPLLATLFLAAIEFGMLWAGNQQVKLASVQGCRVATLPGAQAADVKRAVHAALGQARLTTNCQVLIEGGACAGDPVAVEVVVPMNAAAPDLLFVFGLGLKQRQLIGRTVMCME